MVAYPADLCLDYDQLTAFVIERLPRTPFVILGESFSGPSAIEIAATQPHVAGLILASSFAHHPLPTWLALFTSLLDLSWIPTRMISMVLIGSAAPSDLKLRLSDVLSAVPRDIIRARANDVLRVDRRSRLSQTRCPMLCLHGSRDWMVHPRYVAEFLALRPDCQLKWLDAPHMLLATHVNAAAAIDEFCSQLE
ncbi:alpha/beta fold hydrolase [Bradyrhizobium sp. SRS-191]|uniref:alpha/beta fold hydrolase n=1 Tax=Bradyrhizobium sp. SRS-191 TaxID=2962606 RepID=UPI0035BC5881